MRTIAGTKSRLVTRDLTSSYLVETCLDRALDPAGEGARVFVELNLDKVRRSAQEADNLLEGGYGDKSLLGIPISVKDNFDVSGEITRAGSKLRTKASPATHDSHAVTRLRDAGAVLIGRTNMSEFAFSGVGHNPHWGTPGNPWDRKLVPGGSSSGAAVSVADDMALGALGSDTGGSIRVPAALCGLAGFKPTKGRISTEGLFPLSTTLDSVGTIARTISDCRLLDSVLAGLPWQHQNADISTFRFGVPNTVVLDDLDKHVAAAFDLALKAIHDAGATVEELSAPILSEVIQLNQNNIGLSPIEAFALHEHSIREFGASYDPRARKRFESGGAASAADYIRLGWKRQHLVDQFSGEISHLDAILLPTCPIIAPAIQLISNNESEFLKSNSLLIRNAAPFNFLSCCAATIPMHQGGEAPSGLMVVGRANLDNAILTITEALEAVIRTTRHL